MSDSNKTTSTPEDTTSPPEKKADVSTPSSPPKPKLSAAEAEKRREDLVGSSFLGLIVISFGIILVGAIWAIKDLFTTDAFAGFLELSPQTKIFIVGLFLIGILMLSIFLLVLYRRGKDSIMDALFKDKPVLEFKDTEEYIPAKIIAAGALISIFTIFLGLMIGLIGYAIDDETTEDVLGFYNFLGSLTGGALVLIVGVFILIFTSLILGFVYIWQNGYYHLMNFILRNNKNTEVDASFNEEETVLGRIVFIFFVSTVLVVVIGIIWAIADAVNPDGWGETFSNYPFGVQFSLMGGFFTGLFILLIGAMIIYKWGNFMIMSALFVKMHPGNEEKDNLSAKIITIGILIGISMLVLSLIVWVFSFAAGAISGDGVANLFTAIAGLSGGMEMMAVGIVILVFLFLILGFIYFLNNGYYLALDWINKAEQAIDKGLDDAKAKAQKKSADRKAKKKAKKKD